ncbi:hypothetical protein IB75_05475 [Nitrosococcus oceani C-27]|uniref:Uncharacterized protein n=1 Tax=Nitrosococcus oceani C-27 TaxID=314279 RepID=A0A0E2Z3H8_9GAMM|nr:hypothetical protein IB75_05475 [Nitrosococcus oceani C-27]GEM20637.1 hypothetical protein NONS58_20560 [Nitrosococcus oceani]
MHVNDAGEIDFNEIQIWRKIDPSRVASASALSKRALPQPAATSEGTIGALGRIEEIFQQR